MRAAAAGRTRQRGELMDGKKRANAEKRSREIEREGGGWSAERRESERDRMLLVSEESSWTEAAGGED